MKNIIKGINVLEQIPIKEYTILFGIFKGVGIGIAIIAVIIFFIKTKSKTIRLKDFGTKIFLFFYFLGVVMVILSSTHLPWFYEETGKYAYKCILGDDISANYISDNFNVINVEDNIWIIEDK